MCPLLCLPSHRRTHPLRCQYQRLPNCPLFALQGCLLCLHRLRPQAHRLRSPLTYPPPTPPEPPLKPQAVILLPPLHQCLRRCHRLLPLHCPCLCPHSNPRHCPLMCLHLSPRRSPPHCLRTRPRRCPRRPPPTHLPLCLPAHPPLNLPWCLPLVRPLSRRMCLPCHRRMRHQRCLRYTPRHGRQCHRVLRLPSRLHTCRPTRLPRRLPTATPLQLLLRLSRRLLRLSPPLTARACATIPCKALSLRLWRSPLV